MRKVPLMLIAICTVAVTALPLASPANATTPADGSHGRRVTNLPADAAGPAAAAVAAVSQTGIAWTNCKGLGKQFECARVSVPLDWDRPNGKHIELSVIRHLASRPQQRIGSMFMNPGLSVHNGGRRQPEKQERHSVTFTFPSVTSAGV